MPTYEYECRSCGGQYEFFQSIKESPKRKCPGCGKNRLRKLISSGGGLLFKGSGFYITDYRSDDYKKKAGADTGAAKGTDSGGEKKPAKDGANSGAKKEGTGTSGSTASAAAAG